MKRENYYLWLFVGIFTFSVIMIFFENSVFTGHVTSDSTTSSVTISQYYSISLSGNLSSGINFGNQNSTTATNVNASYNYNASDMTEYYITVSPDSNANVDFTIWADGPLNTTGGDEIGLGNETYYFNITTSDIVNPGVGDEVALTTGPVAAGSGVSAGDSVYYRFWLDIPSGIPVGTYNNTINFQGTGV